MYEKFYERPTHLLSFCLGDEGPGSVLQHLKDKGWANELSAGGSYDLPEFELFDVSIDLTPEGLQNWESVVQIVYQYIDKMKKITPQRWQEMFDEVWTVCLVCVICFIFCVLILFFVGSVICDCSKINAKTEKINK